MLLFGKGYLSKNEEKALAAVAKLTDPEKLKEAALNTESAKVRRAALDKMDDRQLLAFHEEAKDDEKKCDAVARIKSQGALMLADKEAYPKSHEAILDRLDEQHLLSMMRQKTEGARGDLIKRLKNQEVLRDMLHTNRSPRDLEVIIDTLDEAHADPEEMKKYAMTNMNFLYTTGTGKAAVRKISDREMLKEIAQSAPNQEVAAYAADRLKQLPEPAAEQQAMPAAPEE